MPVESELAFDNPSHGLELANIYYNSNSFDVALTLCKKTISLIRKLNKCDEAQSDDSRNILGESYYLMGKAFRGLGKESRAQCAFILSAKFNLDPKKPRDEISKTMDDPETTGLEMLTQYFQFSSSLLH